ncbi:hypothetical protein [Halobacillus faecis]|uniref:hypothetical protein n=1 Tax=Halobacillus faecis TaxID=360184 RepID=UPI0011BEAD15|nr:hypothetical protein [Halobacillus faecis]
MRNKTIFTREAARRNVCSTHPPFLLDPSEESLKLNSIVSHYSQLRLKAGWNLFRRDGQIYAENKGVEVEEPDWMDGIIGDESPLSYLQAAVCYHHVKEYSDQKTDVIQQAIIDDAYVRELDLFNQWMFGKVKRSFNPIFFYDSLHHPAVIFFTFHQEGVEVIQKHVHRFSTKSYNLKTLRRAWTDA